MKSLLLMLSLLALSFTSVAENYYPFNPSQSRINNYAPIKNFEPYIEPRTIPNRNIRPQAKQNAPFYQKRPSNYQGEFARQQYPRLKYRSDEQYQPRYQRPQRYNDQYRPRQEYRYNYSKTPRYENNQFPRKKRKKKRNKGFGKFFSNPKDAFSDLWDDGWDEPGSWGDIGGFEAPDINLPNPVDSVDDFGRGMRDATRDFNENDNY